MGARSRISEHHQTSAAAAAEYARTTNVEVIWLWENDFESLFTLPARRCMPL